MNKGWLFALILIVLVIAAGVQAVELYTMKKSISENGFATAVKSSAGAASSSTGSLDSLPQMVGGC